MQNHNVKIIGRLMKLILHYYQKFTLLILIFFLSGCATNSVNPPLNTLSDIQSVSASQATNASQAMTAIRLEAIQDAALSLGAQGGLAWHAKQINAVLQSNQRNLDNIFNFNVLLLSHDVLPPVLMEANNIANLSDDNTVRLADKTYEIVSQARFVTTAPTWQNYLWLNYTQPTLPDKTLLPKNRTEQAIWKQYAAQGWQQGIDQASAIYAENLGRLKRDYEGMILYRKLLAENMVSAPFVAETHLGVTGGGAQMSINDKVLRITALPTLQSNSQSWKPLIAQEPTDNDNQ